MFKNRLFPLRLSYGVTLLTVERESGLLVVRIGRRFILLKMASAAVYRQIDILAVGVAGLAVQITVQADQRKARRFVHLFESTAVNPLFRCVTL